MESVSITKAAALCTCVQNAAKSARMSARLGTLRKARSQVGPRIWRGKARYGRVAQAFALIETGVVDRATANSPLRAATGHKQDDQTAKTKPPAGSCSRILDQGLGPTRARSSRNRPLESPSTIAGLARGWAGRSPPLTPKPTHFASNTRSER
jgi:hypothetical protein